MTFLTEIQRDTLTAGAERADRFPEWPANAWKTLRESGVLGWSIPTEYGGTQQPAEVKLAGAAELAGCCLTTAFALSQREAAVRHLVKGPDHLRERYLPPLARGEIFMTVGLSQLTTSRQHLGPALRVSPLPSGEYQLNGEIPWVTGADQAEAIVAGGTLADGRQLLFTLPAAALTEQISPPLELAALVGSRTSLIRCTEVRIAADCVLAGPAENVLGPGGGGGLETSCLAIGLAAAAIQASAHEAKSRPELRATVDRFTSTLEAVRSRMFELAAAGADPDQALAVRLHATKLVLRATQAALMVAKGAGFVAPHPAQRWVRQAQFFLVWSCPRPVAAGLLADLASGA